ncbi:MAG: DUF169 domain-containing protein [Christensenellaceae bacterium]|jgi:uncharacterized protein (DUF169 family)
MIKQYKWKEINDNLMEHFRLRDLPVAVKYYKKKEDMLATEGLTIEQKLCVPCLAVGRAARMGLSAGITRENFNYDYCRGVHGFCKRDEKWKSAQPFVDRWNHSKEASKAHHLALLEMPPMEGFAAAPLKDGIIKDPDAVVIFATPEQAFWILTSAINEKYKKLNFTFVGESNCNDSWIRTTLTGEISLGIGSNGERVYAGLPHDELMISMTTEDILNVLEGAENMANGRERLCYPVPAFGLVGDIGSVKNPAFEGY